MVGCVFPVGWYVFGLSVHLLSIVFACDEDSYTTKKLQSLIDDNTCVFKFIMVVANMFTHAVVATRYDQSIPLSSSAKCKFKLLGMTSVPSMGAKGKHVKPLVPESSFRNTPTNPSWREFFSQLDETKMQGTQPFCSMRVKFWCTCT